MQTSISILVLLGGCILYRLALKPVLFPSPFRYIRGPKAQSWFMGNLRQLFNSKGLPFHLSLCEQFGGIVKVFGFFGDEQLYISDPPALHSILIKDQDAFEETAVFIESNRVIFGPGLVSTIGAQHKRQRKLMTPLFSPSHLKNLRPVFIDVAERLSSVISHSLETTDILDMSEWLSRAALESVGQSILGYSFDPLDSPVNNPYTSAIKELIPTIFSLSLLRQFAPFLARIGSRKLVDWVPIRAVQKVKDISDVMYQSAVDILEEKRSEFHRGGGVEYKGRDVTSLLLQANEKASPKESMSDGELTGQMTVMIFGAQDTSSSALSRILYLLAQHPEIQDVVRQEIEISTSEDAPMLEAVIKETLRLYPPVPFVRRTCIKERVIPISSRESSTLRIPVGTTLFVGIASANRLDSVWGSDAKEWKPERWINGGIEGKLHELPGVYSGMLTFLGGGRSCIGLQFGLMEIRIILCVLLRRFRFKLTNEEVVWNLSQIVAPAVRRENCGSWEETKGMPLFVEKVVA